MTDELTPEQEADISRLLAEARHDGPIPADVAGRLDAALGELSRDDLISYDRPQVVDLEVARRRRRNAGRLILAAAAVVVGGVAIGQNLDASDTGSDSDPAASVDSADAPRESSAGGSTDDSGAFGEDEGAQAPTAAGANDYLAFDLGEPLYFTSDDFAAEARETLGSPAKVRRDAALSDYDAVAPYAARELWTCPDGDYGEGARIPAYYDEQEAVLVLRRPVAGVQRVDLLQCGTAATLESVDLPAR